MMHIFCSVEDCRYIELGLCKRNNISISEDLECKDYESYLDTEEWKKPFYKRMFDKNNNRICRVRYYGKEIEIKGRTFFVESRSSYAVLTDAITGMKCSTIAIAEDNIGKINKAARKIEVPLDDLPIATYNEVSRKFTYEEGLKDGESDAGNNF